MQVTVHSSISQWIQRQGPITFLPPNSGSAESPTASRVPSAYPAALLWISGAVVSAGSFVIVLQVPVIIHISVCICPYHICLLQKARSHAEPILLSMTPIIGQIIAFSTTRCGNTDSPTTSNKNVSSKKDASKC